MEQSKERKDTQMKESQRPGRVQAGLHLIVLTMLFFAIAMLFNVIALAIASQIQGIALSELADNATRNELFANTFSVRLITFLGSGMSMVLAAFVLPKTIRADTFSFLSADRLGKGIWVALCIVGFIVLIPVMEQLLSWNMSIDLSTISERLNDWVKSTDQASNDAYNVIIGNGTTTDLMVNLLLMAAIPAIAEEFLFRGVLLNILHGLFKNVHLAIFMSALSFTLLHMQLLKVFPMLIMAIAFGYMVYWTGSVWTSVLAHFINNAIAVFSLHAASGEKYEDMLNSGEGFPWYLTLSCLAITVALFIYMQKNAGPKLQRHYE